MGQPVNDGILAGHLQGHHLRQLGAHLGALHWVVIQKHKGIKPQVQFFGQRAQIGRLGKPVDAVRHHVACAQSHILALLQHIEHIRLGILAGQTDQNAFALLCHGKILQCQEGLAQQNTVYSVFAHHAAPQRVVAIKHQHLGCTHLQSVHAACQRQCQCSKVGVRKRNVRELVAPGIKALSTGSVVNFLGAQHMDVRLSNDVREQLFRRHANGCRHRCRNSRRSRQHGQQQRTFAGGNKVLQRSA